jgi:flagellar biosynthesis regulator FlaF
VAEAKAIGGAIIDGITEGLFGGESEVSNAATGIASKALNSARSFLGIKSPSTKFYELGKYVNQGFINGLQGGRKDVEKAVSDMLGKLNDLQRDAKNRADAARQSLEKLYSARKLDWLAINKQQQALNQANHELRVSANSYSILVNHLKGYRHRQMQLASASEVVAQKLEDANKKLEDAKKLRDDYKESVKDDLNDLPEFNERTNLTKYIADFERQIADTQKFATAVQELRKRGLNDTMYRELIAKGPEAMPFVQQLLDQGTEGVGKLNSLGTALDKASTSLATQAAASLYDAGVKAAQGLVDGLKKQQASIDKEMARIAGIIVREMKKQLGIRSPSRVMEAIGKQIGAGLSLGIQRSSGDVQSASEIAGQSAIDGMRKTLSGLGEAISQEMDLTPVISPVLDLNAVRKDASLLGSMLAVTPIDIQDQVTRAKDAAAGLRDNQLALEELTVAGSGDTIEFTQNNYSPKALSSADIYRQTNNQLSRARGALAT